MTAPSLAQILAARLVALPPETRREVLASMQPAELEALSYCWELWGRPDQQMPPGSWRTWLLLAGRGAGKTRAASEAIRAEVEAGRRMQIGIIGPTADAVRRIMIQGPSGLLACAAPWCRPEYEASQRRIVWPNGSVGYCFTAEEPDRLRGPNLDYLWLDELASYPDAETVWDMAQMALRIPGPRGHEPAAIITTTPRPIKLLKAIMAAPSTVITRARTHDNAANLDASTLRYLTEKYGGTSLGRQELGGELIEDNESALWLRATLDACRVTTKPEMKRIVVSVDPSGGGRDECGILVCGLGDNGEGYVLQDLLIRPW